MDDDHEIFVWTDLIRGNRKYDHLTRYCVSFPLIRRRRAVALGVNLSADSPPLEPQDKWNVVQAAKFNNNAPSTDKALT